MSAGLGRGERGRWIKRSGWGVIEDRAGGSSKGAAVTQSWSGNSIREQTDTSLCSSPEVGENEQALLDDA